MSEFLTAAAQSMGVPETLVQRSAEARAKETGADADAILRAWAGGEAIGDAPSSPADEPQPAQTPAAQTTGTQTTDTQTASVSEPSSEPASVSESVPAHQVAVLEAPDEVRADEVRADEVAAPEPVIAAALSDRIALSTRIGAFSGLLLALIGWVFGSQFIVSAAGIIGEEDSLRASIAVQPGRLVLTALLISVAIGATIAGLVRLVPSWTSPGMRLTGSSIPSIAVGVLVGGTVGALAAAIMVGLGEPPDLPEDPTQVPVLASVVWGMLAWVGGGWLIGALVQSMGVPDGVEPLDLDEVRAVKGRLVSAFALPVLALLAIAVLVLSFAFVFLSFPSYSPLTGTVIAGSILGFAALSASKPNMRVGLSELMVAAAGIGVVVVLIYAVLQTTGVGGHEEEDAEHTGTEQEGETGEDLPGDGAVEDPVEGDALRIALL